jgi:hypothetical protein
VALLRQGASVRQNNPLFCALPLNTYGDIARAANGELSHKKPLKTE